MASKTPLSYKTSMPTVRQSGSTLVITMIILIVATLLVLSGVLSGTLGYRVAANMQHQREASAIAQAAIDAKLGNANYLKTPPTTADAEVTIGSYKVITAAPRCIGVDTSEQAGKKSQVGVAPIPRHLWEYSATATNLNSGVTVTIIQGVRTEAAIGSPCPN